MSATAADINVAMKEALKSSNHAFRANHPAKHGMSRTPFDRAVIGLLIKKGHIFPDDVSAANCVRLVVGNLINRYIDKLKADKTAAIREMNGDNSLWLNLDQEHDNADTDGLRVCGS